MNQNHHFETFALQTKKLVFVSGDPREQQWLHHHLPLAVVRGNAASMILACVEVWSDFSHQCISQCCCPPLASLQMKSYCLPNIRVF